MVLPSLTESESVDERFMKMYVERWMERLPWYTREPPGA